MEHGIVTSVTYEDGIVYCDVRPVRLQESYTDIPVMKPHSGFIQIPKQGERVAMDSLDDGTRFITEVISRESDHPDDMSEGDLAIQLDGGTMVRFEEKQSGDYDLHVEASGQVIIQGIPFLEHVHPYTDDEIPDTGDGSGSEQVQNKDTDPPK